jgi:hypothetical protein
MFMLTQLQLYTWYELLGFPLNDMSISYDRFHNFAVHDDALCTRCTLQSAQMTLPKKLFIKHNKDYVPLKIGPWALHAAQNMLRLQSHYNDGRDR